MLKSLKKTTVIATSLLAAVIVSGCTTSGSVSRTNFTQSVETAPAFLQLICAYNVADKYSVPSDAVLPVRSKRKADHYSVALSFADTKAECLINEKAEIKSVMRIVS